MAFITKVDYCGLAQSGVLDVSGDSDGKSGTVVTGGDEYGTVVATTFVSGGSTPSNTYDVKSDVQFTGDNVIKLGKVSTVGSSQFALSSVSFSTGAGSAPSFSAQAQDVESGGSADWTYNLPAFTLANKYKAQLVFSEATISGVGCSLIGSTYNASAPVSVGRDELGDPISSGCTSGSISAQLTIQQNGSVKPVVTPSDGWVVTSALTGTNSKGAYPTFTVTLTKYLALVEA